MFCFNQFGDCEGAMLREGNVSSAERRLSCHEFKNNVVRLPLFVLAYTLGNFLRRLALPKEVPRWSLTPLREQLVKIGARLARPARWLILQMAEVAVTRDLFAQILSRMRLLPPGPT